MDLRSRAGRVGVVLFLVGCGGGAESVDSYKGDYELTSVTAGETSCEQANEVAQTIDPADQFFRLQREEFLGAEMLSLVPCSAAKQCETSGGFFNSFFLDEAGDWSANISSASSGGTSGCSYSFTSRVLSHVDKTHIQILRKRHEWTDAAATSDKCTSDFAMEEGPKQTCTSIER